VAVPQPPDTRTAILDAAERLFSQRGFAATTIKQIGAEAGVNAALLYYYFADKETLYREVLGRLLSGLITAGGKAFDEAHSPEEAIRSLIRVQAGVLGSTPFVPRLIARELVDNEASHATQHIARLAAELFTRLCEMIRDGQRAGIFRDDLDPAFAAISTISQVVYFHIARPAVGIILGHGASGPPPEAARAFALHAADFAISALSVRPLASPTTKPTRSPRRATSRKPS
jgi:TetR/AcrR family transcriptional regulator